MNAGALRGRRILVVGGAAGIGAATVALFRDEGAKVAILDRARPAGDSADALVLADVRDTAAVDRAVAEAAAALGGLDGLVFCAGIDFLGVLAETTDEDWLTVMDVNLNGAMRVTRAALRVFAPEGGGTIVLVSSAAGLKPLALRSAYCASKAGLIMLAKALAEELAPRGIRVNALCPGAVDTDLFRGGLTGDAEITLQAVRDRYALKRIAAPQEMASVLLFLSGPASNYVTGTALAADGGRVFH